MNCVKTHCFCHMLICCCCCCCLCSCVVVMVSFLQRIHAVCARACSSPAGNIIFLPRGAVVIDIVPENNEDKSPWVVYMCADFKPLFISPIVIPPQKTVLQMAKVRRSKEWAMLTPYWRQRILREGVCPEVFPWPITFMLRHTLLTSCYRLICGWA